jgi:SAM-dependent methyltransferase
VIVELPSVVPAPGPNPAGPNTDHPMRRLTESVAGDERSWTATTASDVERFFDDLAPGWNDRVSGDPLDAIDDAFERGGPLGGRCLELGSGTGVATPRLVGRVASLVAMDISGAMLRLAPPEAAPRVQADSARLPVRDGAADTVVLVNTLLFASEVERVLAPGGAVVWVNTLGDHTPIHLSAPAVEAALPGAWVGVASLAAWGSWCVLRRA